MWIHGGGNVVGSAHVYDPSLLASKHEIVVVTIQYRMGPLGWFRHPALHGDNSSDLDKSGNYGTLDTIKALEWINENIEYFVILIMLLSSENQPAATPAKIFASPLAKGLYHKVSAKWNYVSRFYKFAETYTPENGIAPTISGKDTFNQVLIITGKASNEDEAISMQESMNDEEIKELFMLKKLVFC